jgi:hypothetical protein
MTDATQETEGNPMDPTANLREQLEIVRAILDLECEPIEPARLRIAAERLAELVEALNGWLSRGGFLPLQWRAIR